VQVYASIDEFLTATADRWGTPNGFVSTAGLYLYIRRSKRLLRDELVSALDFASMSTEEGYHQHDIFSRAMALRAYFRLVAASEDVAIKHCLRLIYIENLLQDKWIPMFERLGYRRYNPERDPVICLFKELPAAA